jgi:hypothetical protein
MYKVSLFGTVTMNSPPPVQQIYPNKKIKIRIKYSTEKRGWQSD